MAEEMDFGRGMTAAMARSVGNSQDMFGLNIFVQNKAGNQIKGHYESIKKQPGQ